jgi:hypothetical protein
MVKEIKIDKKENTTVLRFYLDIANNITDWIYSIYLVKLTVKLTCLYKNEIT